MTHDNPEFDLAFELLNTTSLHFFLSGKAGTGKSTWIKKAVNESYKNIIVVAPTGVAALNVGGQTIHSFFKLPSIPIVENDQNLRPFKQQEEKFWTIQEAHTIIIDEISMVRADVLDGIDQSLRLSMDTPSTPFGGKQIILVGDIFQLPPVVTESHKNVLKQIYFTENEDFFFFESRAFKKLDPIKIELKKNYRQVDPLFDGVIDKMRINGRDKKITSSELSFINSQVHIGESNIGPFTVTLTSNNYNASVKNKERLNSIREPLFQFKAEISGDFDIKKYPTDSILELKKGCQVILLKNDAEHRWVNGTIAVIHELADDTVNIALKNGSIYQLEKATWENLELKYDKQKKKVLPVKIGTFWQYPIRLAWSITIHKSQGLTFDKCSINLNEQGFFASGQCYTAFSRTKSLDGIYLNRPLRESDFYTLEGLADYYYSYDEDGIQAKDIHWILPLYRSPGRTTFKSNFLSSIQWFQLFNATIEAQNYQEAENLIIAYQQTFCCDEDLCSINYNFKTGFYSKLFKTEGNDFLKSLIYFYVYLDNYRMQQALDKELLDLARKHLLRTHLKSPNKNTYLLLCRILMFTGKIHLAKLIYKSVAFKEPSYFGFYIGATSFSFERDFSNLLFLGAWVLNPICRETLYGSFSYLRKLIIDISQQPKKNLIALHKQGTIQELLKLYNSAAEQINNTESTLKYAFLSKKAVGKKNLILKFIGIDIQIINENKDLEIKFGDTVGYAFLPLSELGNHQETLLSKLKLLELYKVELLETLDVNGTSQNILKAHLPNF